MMAAGAVDEWDPTPFQPDTINKIKKIPDQDGFHVSSLLVSAIRTHLRRALKFLRRQESLIPLTWPSRIRNAWFSVSR
jgi:hypothetical protein